jgi:hypothetical protein
MPNKDIKLRFVIDSFDCKLNTVIENPVINDFKKLVNKKNTAILSLLSTINNSLRTKVFEDMFANDMIENHSNKCSIDDIESEVFEELLTFIYIGVTKS